MECDAVDQGAWRAVPQRALTYLTYVLTYRTGGMSPVAFHAGNLALHAAVSLVLLGFARDFLAVAAEWPEAPARRVSGWAALLFAAHPLCSEMPNYARARDIGLVTLCALLAAWAALRWRRDGAWRWLGAAGAAVAAGTFSKEVGLPLAVGTAVLAVLGTAPRARGGEADPARRHRALLLVGGGVAALVGIGVAGGLFSLLFNAARHSLATPRLGWHVLTEARVFWMYLARVAWPAGLCSDHQIAWTISAGDAVSWGALAAEVAVAVAATVALCRRREPTARAAGALAAVALLDIVHRLFNVSGELMVEYRMYPAMGPICIGLAWGLDAALRRAPTVRRTALGAAVAACVIVSALRALDWRSLDALVANVAAQYPGNARAQQELQEADVRAGRWEAVVARQDAVRRAFDDATAYNAAHALRRYDADHLTMTRIVSEGNVALALARTGRRAEAFARLTWMHTVMDDAHLASPFFWSAYYYASALVHDAAGQRPDALDDLRASVEISGGGLTYQARQLRRYEGGEPLP